MRKASLPVAATGAARIILGLAVFVAIAVNAQSPDAGGNDLITAAGAGDLPRVKALLAAKADVNAKGGDGGTALMAASRNGHQEVVQLLENAGAKEE